MMIAGRLSWGGLMLALLVSCQDNTTNEPGAAAGAGGAAHDEPTGECGPQPLAEFCKGGRCPRAPDDVEAYCQDPPARTSLSTTRCGGTVVSTSLGLGQTNYFFDANDELVGVTTLSDLPDPCFSSESTPEPLSRTYGETCAAEGPKTDPCEQEPECSPTTVSVSEYCETERCPATPDDIDLGYCARNAPIDSPRISQASSSCGGVAISIGDIFSGTVYHWNEDGELVSVAGWSDASFCDVPIVIGADCAVVGDEMMLCGDSERCPTTALPELCAHEPDACLSTPGEVSVQARCDDPGEVVYSFEGACAGSVYRHVASDRRTEWTFDADGKLVGVVIAGSEVERCLDGGYSKVAVFGKPCEAPGEGELLCGDTGEGGAGGAGGAD
jgi:hypothetical protein